MRMREWTEYYVSPTKKKILNVISLEFSNTRYGNFSVHVCSSQFNSFLSTSNQLFLNCVEMSHPSAKSDNCFFYFFFEKAKTRTCGPFLLSHLLAKLKTLPSTPQFIFKC